MIIKYVARKDYIFNFMVSDGGNKRIIEKMLVGLQEN